MSDTSPPLSSHRAERLRSLCAELDSLSEDSTDDNVNKICQEVFILSNDIMGAPSPGLVGLVERAMAVNYFYRPGGSASGPGADVEYVQWLVAAVLAMAPAPPATRPA